MQRCYYLSIYKLIAKFALEKYQFVFVMKLVLNVNDKIGPIILKVLRFLPFMEIDEVKSKKDEILDGIKESAEEMKLIRAGKRKGIPARELVNEL